MTAMILRGGLVYDGTGAQPILADVLVRHGGIAKIGPVEDSAAEVFDCAGLAVAPGFIDLHSHSDLQVLDWNRTEKAHQGVTTEVVGNCGFSPFPTGDHAAELCEWGGGILGAPGGWGWARARDYLDSVERAKRRVNVAPLAGHGSLRVAVAGLRQGPLSGGELDRLAGMLEDSLDAGCAGFSTGLMYAPGSTAPGEELVRLCAIVAGRGKLYSTHMRSYAEGLVEAVREQIALARSAGCRLQISHLQAAGRGNWERQQQALDEIEKAREEGVDVEFDIYPYQCGSTVLTQWLPAWSIEGGGKALAKRLADPAMRAKIREQAEHSRAQEWSDITISACEDQELIGRTIEEIGGVDGALDLLAENAGAVNVISFNQSETNLRQLLTHPLCSVISDGFYVKGKPHPRLHGTFPELLGSVVRDRGWMGLAEAIHKITGKPAARLGLGDRGLLKAGYAADITVFDPLKIKSHATYAQPERHMEGIALVLKDGVAAQS